MDINLGAVIAAAVVSMVVGYVWYSRPLFAKAWAGAAGKNIEDMSGSEVGYALTAAGSLAQAYVLAVLVHWRAADTFLLGAKVGFLAWLGFVATAYASSYVFEGRSRKLYYINTGYFLVVLVINGAILAVWR